MTTPPVYVVSGGEGTSGEQIVRTALAQFADNEAPVVIVPHVRSAEQLEMAIARVVQAQGILAHTLVDANLRQELIHRARENNVIAVDLIGGLLSQLTTLLGREPLGQPGLYRQLRESYFERIEAIEFTVKHDDGRNPQDLAQAEIVLVGVSRVGKTPLAMYLSVQGWKVANVPLVPQIDPPEELFAIDARRVIGLTVAAEELVAYRRWRQRRFKMPNRPYQNSYADVASVEGQLEVAEQVFRRGQFVVLDVTDKPIEESAAEIIALISRRLGG